MVDMQSIERQFVLPCFFAMLGPNVAPLHHRYCYAEDGAWLVSIFNDNDGYAVDKNTICLTLLFCNA